MFDRESLLLWIPALPILAAIVSGLMSWTRGVRQVAHWPVLIGACLSAICAVAIACSVANNSHSVRFPAASATDGSWVWFEFSYGSERVVVPFSLQADQLTCVMLLGVTFIGFWIVVFSVGYMRRSPGFARYFATMSLFLGSMNLLVLANNFLLLFAGWEGVGLCSYLLVGYWHNRPAAAAAARKAFLVTRLGDVGLILGIVFLWWMSGMAGFEFDRTFMSIERMAATYPALFPTACVLIVCGAVGKSAQFPLYVWLPDAMEGPTPVSALIHAATMVTAGVYLLARCAPLLVEVPAVTLLVAVIGTFTALLAALVALTQHDLKRILAYSTVSQIGFMFLAIGCIGPVSAQFAVTAAVFHLFTHAFFKAVLFLASGSVMHAMNDVIDMRSFGGLRKVLPITHLAFLVGAMALAGVPLFSGFFSKDMIFDVVHSSASSARFGTVYLLLFATAVATAVLTAFYAARAYFLTFCGKLRMPNGAHPHESLVMSVPLAVLGTGALCVGLIAGPMTNWFIEYVGASPFLKGAAPVSHHINWGLVIGSGIAAIAGVAMAYYVYCYRPTIVDAIVGSARGLYQCSRNKFYVDEIFRLMFVQPIGLLAGVCEMLESTIYDMAKLVASIPRAIGVVCRPLQNGQLQFYGLSMTLGIAVILGYLVFIAR